MKDESGIRWKSPLIATALLVALMAIASFLVTRFVNDYEEQQSFTRLQTEADTLAQKIQTEMVGDREELEILASQAAQSDDPSFSDFLDTMEAYGNIGSIARLELLLPDDTVLTKDGRRIDVSGALSFSEEAAQGEHISDRERDILDPDQYVVRSFVPVVRNGEAVALLYGVIELGTLPDALAATPYGGKAAMYLIDGNTGDFLVDTWHPGQTGNIWALGSREMAPGYDNDQLQQDLEEGRSGYVVFLSQSAGEQLYFYFQPTGINHWSVALSVPESVVFERATAIRNTLNLFLGFEIVCFVLYFVWMLLHVRHESNVKQRQLDTISYIYDVEKLLFNAHVNQDYAMQALEKVGSMTSASRVGLWLCADGEPRSCFLCDAPGTENGGTPARGEQPVPPEDDFLNLRHLIELFEGGAQEFTAFGKAELSRALPRALDGEAASLIAVPIKDPDGTLHAVLTARDVRKDVDTSLLHSIELSLGMYCRNLRTYRNVKRQGETDALLGLFNRNRYEQDRPHLSDRCRHALCCIYIDVNGLHELNNTEGHDAGDEMLRTVAAQIRERFGTAGSYRIGGDEFVVFVFDGDEASIQDSVTELERRLASANIRVSIGMERREQPFSVDDLIKAAEAKMYAAKRRFYEQSGNDRRAPRQR